MKEKLLEKEASVKKRDPVESSIKKVCSLHDWRCKKRTSD